MLTERSRPDIGPISRDALKLGQAFSYPTLTGALDDLIGRASNLSEEPRLEAHLDHRRQAAR